MMMATKATATATGFMRGRSWLAITGLRLHALKSTTTSLTSRIRNFSSNSSSFPIVDEIDRWEFSRSSLGFENMLIRPVLSTIKQLPEVEKAFETFPSNVAMDHLHRATQIFSSYNKNGQEHIAILAMIAECQQRLAQYDDSIKTLQDIQMCIQQQQPADTAPPHLDATITLACAKVYWLNGQFIQSKKLCESIIGTYNDRDESFPTTNLHIASAMTGKAVSQLCAMKNMEDAYSVRDYFNICNKFLQRHPPSATVLPQATGLANAGVAEAVYSMYLEQNNNISVPINAALKNWFQGLQKIITTTATTTNKGNSTILRKASSYQSLQSTIQSNIAWGVLHYEDKDRTDRLSKASEYAKKALAIYNNNNNNENDSSLLHPQPHLGNDGLIKVLSIIAACYEQADDVITAEGLFQSAITTTNNKNVPLGTLAKLELRDAYIQYANLCGQSQGDNTDTKRRRRDSDVTNFLQKAKDIDDTQLPMGWKGKSAIHGSLWFWTPGEFLE
jgi:tetratricopeptide (TPR) repeat protein